eukprot:gene9132-biopygen2481
MLHAHSAGNPIPRITAIVSPTLYPFVDAFGVLSVLWQMEQRVLWQVKQRARAVACAAGLCSASGFTMASGTKWKWGNSACAYRRTTGASGGAEAALSCGKALCGVLHRDIACDGEWQGAIFG